MTWNPFLGFNGATKKLVTVKETSKASKQMGLSGKDTDPSPHVGVYVSGTIHCPCSASALHSAFHAGLHVCKLPFQGSLTAAFPLMAGTGRISEPKKRMRLSCISLFVSSQWPCKLSTVPRSPATEAKQQPPLRMALGAHPRRRRTELPS